MIRNVFGKAVTTSTLKRLPEYDPKYLISRESLAAAALAMKNSQGKDDKEAVRYVKTLTEKLSKEDCGYTLGWIYNASGVPISFVESRNWNGGVISNPYPVRIENGQWGLFLHKQDRSGSSAAIVYQAAGSCRQTFDWCLAWNNPYAVSAVVEVHAKIVRSDVWREDEWKNVKEALATPDLTHMAKKEGWISVISATSGPEVVLEALFALEHLE